MSGIGEFAYTILLGWMRALVDWGWAMFSGTGNTGAWQWFLSNWKIWLLVLLVGGLVVDRIMWFVRWRPHWLLFSRLRRAPAEGTEAWDSGVGYYEPEIAADSATPDWTETTFATLSEIDPNWAEGMSLDAGEEYYDPDYDPAALTGHVAQPETSYENPYADPALWDDDEETAPAPAAQDDAYYAPQEEVVSGDTRAFSTAAFSFAPATEPEAAGQFDPFAPYDAYDGNEAPQPEPVQEAYNGPLQYGRPGMWPGAQHPFMNAEADEPPQPQQASPGDVPPQETASWDPLFNPDGPKDEAEQPRRRRRRLRESDQPVLPQAPAEDTYDNPIPSWMDIPGQQPQADEPAEGARAERLVFATDDIPGVLPRSPFRRKKEDLRTVTGRPVKQRGLRRFSLEEEPISGLPPMEVTDPFMPAARPENPDFMKDEGEEYLP